MADKCIKTSMNKPPFNADAAEEYFTNLCIYYRDSRNAIFKKDNEGRHVTEQIYSPEYQKFLGMELALRKVLEYFSKFDLGQPDSGESLTLEDLKEMDGEPVWVTSTNNGRGRSWALVDRKYEVCRAVHGGLAVFENYGKTWLAYRRKPEEAPS